MSTEKFDTQIPLMLRTLENSLRGGYNLLQAFEKVASDVPAPLGKDTETLIADMKKGDMPKALDNWHKRTPSTDLDLVLATLRVQFETGGNLADKLNLLGQILEHRSA
ncbi:MAG TPA: type II secretion system F family protein [Anaerolineales bacterium]|nr:type II secretion system F family protein [Anaerolineales bacterium]